MCSGSRPSSKGQHVQLSSDGPAPYFLCQGNGCWDTLLLHQCPGWDDVPWSPPPEALPRACWAPVPAGLLSCPQAHAPRSCSSQGLELCARLCPSPSGVWPFRASGTTAEQRGKQRGRRGRGRSLVTAAQRDHPRGCGPLHSPVPPDGGGARGEPSRAPAGLRSGPRAQAAALHS